MQVNMGQRCSDTRGITFDEVIVPDANPGRAGGRAEHREGRGEHGRRSLSGTGNKKTTKCEFVNGASGLCAVRPVGASRFQVLSRHPSFGRTTPTV